MSNRSDNQPRFSTYIERAKSNDLMNRSVLTTEDRFAIQVAGIFALSLDAPQQEREFIGLLEAGCPFDLFEDVLIQLAAYLGYPRVAQALEVLQQAAQKSETLPASTAGPDAGEGSNEARYQRGVSIYKELNPDALATIQSAFGEISGDFVQLTFRAFGDVFASSRQPLVRRQLATVSALAVLGSAAPQLRFHINAAFHVGVSHQQIIEVIAWTQFLAGMPAAYNALVELKTATSEGSAPAYK